MIGRLRRDTLFAPRSLPHSPGPISSLIRELEKKMGLKHILISYFSDMAQQVFSIHCSELPLNMLIRAYEDRILSFISQIDVPGTCFLESCNEHYDGENERKFREKNVGVF